MTENEMCRMFRGAKHRGKQVYILAQLNLCKVDDVLKILLRNGEKITKEKVGKKIYMKAKSILDGLNKELEEKKAEMRGYCALIIDDLECINSLGVCDFKTIRRNLDLIEEVTAAAVEINQAIKIAQEALYPEIDGLSDEK